MSKNTNFIVSVVSLAVYVTFFFAMAVAIVGEPPKEATAADWGLPFKVLIFMAIPAWFGYEIGKSRGE